MTPRFFGIVFDLSPTAESLYQGSNKSPDEGSGQRFQ